jgi:hypothetical protein
MGLSYRDLCQNISFVFMMIYFLGSCVCHTGLFLFITGRGLGRALSHIPESD